MNIKIQITRAVVEYVAEKTGMDLESADELLLDIIPGLIISPDGGGEDHLFQTSKAILAYYDQHGPEKTRLLFGSLAILDVCRNILAEGEGRPHPWY